MKSTEIREKFLEFFESKEHKRYPSVSLIPSDPTVLLTMAGMLPFKPIFLGTESPKHKRVASCQKCIRTNDIDKVGHTTRHHTFFEMLGNFSFGDYFKEDAISFAWEFLTQALKIDKKNLVVAVYEKDDEGFKIWEEKIKIPGGKIYRLDKENNFWAAGPTGPCGPCSEIYYDYGTTCKNPNCNPACDCERFLELWNLVFMEYDCDEKGTLKPLPKKNIDTGMGLERITRVLQGKLDNFDTDIFEHIFKKLPGKDVYSKIIADHARAIAYLIADLVLPSNEGRGYVLRRLIRRVALYGKKIGIKNPFIYEICKTVIDEGKGFYHELGVHEKLIKNTLNLEESNFIRNLENGMKLFDTLLANNQSTKEISAEDAFKLHDTYGFPFEITEEIITDKGFKINKEKFYSLMEQQKDKARKAGLKSDEKSIQLKNLYEETYGKTKFIGYDKFETEAKILAVIPEEKVIVLDKTPFYPGGGGQVCDTGVIQDSIVSETIGEVGGIILHKVDKVENFSEGQHVKVWIDFGRRKNIMAHHTATHLLHAALKKVLGDEVKQAGSNVSADGFRFDFNFPKAMDSSEIEQVEKIVNLNIKEHIPVEKIETSFDKAKAMGAIALFSEKYGEKVRVIKIGDISLELCGGCHVNNIEEIKFFKVVKEEALQSGIRRIEAVAGEAAKVFIVYKSKNLTDQISELMRQHRLLQAKRELLGGNKFLEADIFDIDQTEIETLLEAANEQDIYKVNKFLEHLQGRLEWLKERSKALQKNICDLETGKALDEVNSLMDKVQIINGIKIIAANLCEISIDNLRIMADKLKNSLGSGIIILASIISDKVLFVVFVTEDLVSKGYNAFNIAKILWETCDGGGGGRPNKAEAGGKDPSKVGNAIEKVISFLTDIK